MTKLWHLLIDVTVESADLDLNLGYDAGFLNAVTWADNRDAAREKVEKLLEDYRWHIRNVEKTFFLREKGQYPEPLQVMIDRAKTKPNEVVLSPLHNSRSL